MAMLVWWNGLYNQVTWIPQWRLKLCWVNEWNDRDTLPVIINLYAEGMPFVKSNILWSCSFSRNLWLKTHIPADKLYRTHTLIVTIKRWFFNTVCWILTTNVYLLLEGNPFVYAIRVFLDSNVPFVFRVVVTVYWDLTKLDFKHTHKTFFSWWGIIAWSFGWRASCRSWGPRKFRHRMSFSVHFRFFFLMFPAK
jgi:hypothetical protein